MLTVLFCYFQTGKRMLTFKSYSVSGAVIKFAMRIYTCETKVENRMYLQSFMFILFAFLIKMQFDKLTFVSIIHKKSSTYTLGLELHKWSSITHVYVANLIFLF